MVRPEKMLGATYKLRWPESEHAMYVTVNDIELDGVRRPFEVFVNSKNLEHYAWVVALTRMISAVFRRGGEVAFVAEELQQVFDPRGGQWSQGRYIPSLVAAIGAVLERHMVETGFVEKARPHAPAKRPPSRRQRRRRLCNSVRSARSAASRAWSRRRAASRACIAAGPSAVDSSCSEAGGVCDRKRSAVGRNNPAHGGIGGSAVRRLPLPPSLLRLRAAAAWEGHDLGLRPTSCRGGPAIAHGRGDHRCELAVPGTWPDAALPVRSPEFRDRMTDL